MKNLYSAELAKYRLEKAKNELEVARVALKLGNYENSVVAIMLFMLPGEHFLPLKILIAKVIKV